MLSRRSINDSIVQGLRSLELVLSMLIIFLVELWLSRARILNILLQFKLASLWLSIPVDALTSLSSQLHKFNSLIKLATYRSQLLSILTYQTPFNSLLLPLNESTITTPLKTHIIKPTSSTNLISLASHLRGVLRSSIGSTYTSSLR